MLPVFLCGLASLLTAAFTMEGASAAKYNGGATTFPYSLCDNRWNSCIQVQGPVMGQVDSYATFTFTVSALCDSPFTSCSEDLNAIKWNTFSACKWSKIEVSYTWKGVVVPIPTPTFEASAILQDEVPGGQVLKVTQLGLMYSQLMEAPATFVLRLRTPYPGLRRCQTFDQLFNTTANPPGVPYAMALYSSDNKCCPLGPPPPGPILSPEPSPVSSPMVPVPSPLLSPVPVPNPSPLPSPAAVASPSPSPVSSPIPSPLPSPLPSPVPSPILSPITSPIPSPVPSPLPSPTPSPGGISCSVCVTFKIVLAGSAADPPPPNGVTCSLLAHTMTSRTQGYMNTEAMSRGRSAPEMYGNSSCDYTCSGPASPPARNGTGIIGTNITVCAHNLSDSRPVRNALADNTSREFVDILLLVGYGKYTCGIELWILDSCSTILVLSQTSCSRSHAANHSSGHGPMPGPSSTPTARQTHHDDVR